LRVEGSIPKELDGRFVRNGPNPISNIDPSKHHWFLGNGMVHGVCLNNGKAPWYRNRLMRSPETIQILGETPLPDPFDGQPRIFAANTNIPAASAWKAFSYHDPSTAMKMMAGS
jgi:carotenoid cleavage dioxygenase